MYYGHTDETNELIISDRGVENYDEGFWDALAGGWRWKTLGTGMDGYKKSETSLHILYLMPLSLKVYILLQNEKSLFSCIFGSHSTTLTFSTQVNVDLNKKKINEVLLEAYLYMLSFILNTLYK